MKNATFFLIWAYIEVHGGSWLTFVAYAWTYWKSTFYFTEPKGERFLARTIMKIQRGKFPYCDKDARLDYHESDQQTDDDRTIGSKSRTLGIPKKGLFLPISYLAKKMLDKRACVSQRVSQNLCAIVSSMEKTGDDKLCWLHSVGRSWWFARQT